jgi:hypothetical protein
MKARGYIDTIMAYYAPRACEVLGLDCALTNVNQVPAKEYLTVSPVPANNYLRIESKSGEQIQTVHIYDMQGRLLQTKESEHSNVVEMNRNDLPSGQYILRVFFKDAVASQFIQFH